MIDRPTTKSWEDAVLWLKAQPDRATLVRDAYYDDPLIDAAKRYWHSDEWSAIRPLLREHSGEALDLGAGRGIASYALVREGYSVTAIEPDPSAIVGAAAIRALATSQKLPIQVVEEAGERLPFDDGRFGVVFARAVLHHTKDLQATCCEVFRVLRPGGRLIAVREHVISRSADLPAFFAEHPLHHLYGGENAFLLKEYLAALKRSGLQPAHVLGPFDSPINLFPHTTERLREQWLRRAGRIPAASKIIASILSSELRMSLFLSARSYLSRHPGRLYSFVCDKPW